MKSRVIDYPSKPYQEKEFNIDIDKDKGRDERRIAFYNEKKIGEETEEAVRKIIKFSNKKKAEKFYSEFLEKAKKEEAEAEAEAEEKANAKEAA